MLLQRELSFKAFFVQCSVPSLWESGPGPSHEIWWRCFKLTRCSCKRNSSYLPETEDSPFACIAWWSNKLLCNSVVTQLQSCWTGLCKLRVVRHWHRLPNEVANALSLEAFKARLDGALSNLVYREVSLPIARELDLHDLKGPFQP